MRTLVTFGSIAAFIAMAFVNPSDSMVSAREAVARTQLSSVAAAAMFTGTSVSPEELQKAATLMKALANDDQLTAYAGTISTSLGVANSKQLLGQAATVLSGAMPTPKKIVQRAVQIALPIVPRSKDWIRLLQTEQDVSLRDMYESIDWAQRKSSVEYCRDFDPVNATQQKVGMPTQGDLLALCLAKVSGNAARCEQIDSLTAPTLKSICETELVTEA